VGIRKSEKLSPSDILVLLCKGQLVTEVRTQDLGFRVGSPAIKIEKLPILFLCLHVTAQHAPECNRLFMLPLGL
jgi:hypothetical protein